MTTDNQYLNQANDAAGASSRAVEELELNKIKNSPTGQRILAELERLRAYEAETKAKRAEGSTISREEETLRGEVMKLTRQLTEVQGENSGLEGRLAEAEKTKATLQDELDDAIKSASENGTELAKADERVQKLRAELETANEAKELLSQERGRLEVENQDYVRQLQGKTKGDTLVLHTELECLLRAANNLPGEEPQTDAGKQLYTLLKRTPPSVTPTDPQAEKKFKAVKKDAQKIVTALSEGREPNDLEAPFMNALYQAFVTKLGEAAPAQTPGDDISSIGNAYLLSALADIAETGKVPDGLPSEADDSKQRMVALHDRYVKPAHDSQNPALSAAKQPSNTKTSSPQTTAPTDVRKSASGRHMTIEKVVTDREALEQIDIDAEMKLLEARIADLQSEKAELENQTKAKDALLNEQTAELNSTMASLTSEVDRATQAEQLYKELLANQPDPKELADFLDTVKAARDLESKLAEATTRAETAEARVNAYDNGTKTPRAYEAERDGLNAHINALKNELATLTTQRDKLETRLKTAGTEADPTEESDQEYMTQLSRILAIVYHWHKEGKPFAPEVIAALAQLGDRDKEVEDYYKDHSKNTDAPQIALGTYARARQALNKAAQHGRTGRIAECNNAYDLAARLFEETIIEDLRDKKVAFNSALLASQAQSALRSGSQAIAWAHLAERLAPANEKFRVYSAICEAYAAAGDTKKATEYLALAQNHTRKPTLNQP